MCGAVTYGVPQVLVRLAAGTQPKRSTSGKPYFMIRCLLIGSVAHV
jgi:hypothetical protein